MIPKSRKFPLRTEFVKFRRRANTLSSPHLTLYHSPSPSPSRLAVIVSKKVSRFATTRNWLKRLTHNTFWPLVKDTTLDLVIIYKPHKLTKTTATKAQLTTELRALYRQL